MPIESLMGDTTTQLMWLRAFTQRTGALHEAQVLNLKMWPACVFLVKSSEFSFEWENRRITFDIALKERKPRDRVKRFEALDQWVKTLLGNDYETIIKLNGKLEHIGNRTIVAPGPAKPVYDREKFEESVWRNNFETVLKEAESELNVTSDN